MIFSSWRSRPLGRRGAETLRPGAAAAAADLEGTEAPADRAASALSEWSPTGVPRRGPVLARRLLGGDGGVDPGDQVGRHGAGVRQGREQLADAGGVVLGAPLACGGHGGGAHHENLPTSVTSLRDAQMPEDVIWLVSYLFGSVLDGRNERLSDDILRVLGRPPRDFADFARDVAATGFWRT